MIEAGDNVYLIEPQKGRKDRSYVAYKMKRFNMTFENSGGKRIVLSMARTYFTANYSSFLSYSV